MVPKTNWTIQDYLKQAGMAADGMRRKAAVPPSPGESEHAFSRVLADTQGNARAADQAAGGGRRLADYLKTPVAAKLHRPSNPAPAGSSSPDRIMAPVCAPNGQPVITEPPSTKTATQAASMSAERMAAQAVNTGSVTQRIDASIEKAASDYDLPVELIRGVIQAESNFQVRAVSPAGAHGLMQLMPGTARELGVDDPFDIQQNIDGGARYLRRMLDMFGGDVKQALSAYNAGPGTVMKYDGQVPYPETRHYVRKVMLYAQR
jgi:soluble lytic murein transglycosylase-like protein